MRIETSSYSLSEDALEIWKKKMQEQAVQEQQKKDEKDTYVPSYAGSDNDIAIPTGTYNARGVENSSAISNSSAPGYEALISKLSDTFRANADSILSTMESLGLSLEDLQDEDNLQTLADAMNTGAKSLGLPVASSDLETLVSQLYEDLSGNWDTYFASTDASAVKTETV